MVNIQTILAPQALRSGDAIGRYGGEEFMLIFPGCDLTQATPLAERLRIAVAAARFEAREAGPDAPAPGAETAGPDLGRELDPALGPITVVRFTVSIGLAEWDGGSRFDVLVQQADRALYAAKAAGRNRVVGYSAALPVHSGDGPGVARRAPRDQPLPGPFSSGMAPTPTSDPSAPPSKPTWL